MSFKSRDFCCPNEICENHNLPFEKLVEPEEVVLCELCGWECRQAITAHAGYRMGMGDNGASRTPKQAGCFNKRTK